MVGRCPWLWHGLTYLRQIIPKNSACECLTGGTEVALHTGNRACQGATRNKAPDPLLILYPGRTLSCPPAACTPAIAAPSLLTIGGRRVENASAPLRRCSLSRSPFRAC